MQEDYSMTDPPIVIRVEVTDQSGRHLISRDPLAVLQARYAEQDGYRLREVQGYDHPEGLGFCITNRREVGR
jgi:hypothetical protein